MFVWAKLIISSCLFRQNEVCAQHCTLSVGPHRRVELALFVDCAQEARCGSQRRAGTEPPKVSSGAACLECLRLRCTTTLLRVGHTAPGPALAQLWWTSVVLPLSGPQSLAYRLTVILHSCLQFSRPQLHRASWTLPTMLRSRDTCSS